MARHLPTGNAKDCQVYPVKSNLYDFPVQSVPVYVTRDVRSVLPSMRNAGNKLRHGIKRIRQRSHPDIHARRSAGWAHSRRPTPLWDSLDVPTQERASPADATDANCQVQPPPRMRVAQKSSPESWYGVPDPLARAHSHFALPGEGVKGSAACPLRDIRALEGIDRVGQRRVDGGARTGSADPAQSSSDLLVPVAGTE